jgi:hypothetical protein
VPVAEDDSRRPRAAWHAARIVARALTALLALAACSSQVGSGDPDAGNPVPDGASAPSADAAPATDGNRDAADYQPEPIPTIDPEPPAPCPAQTPAGRLQFLDDTCGSKRSPSSVDRDLACPNIHTDAAGYQTSAAPISVDTTALDGIVPDDLQVTVILIRRVGGVPYYRYLSNGRHDDAYQPWSTSKFLAAANAAVTLRTRSGYDVGLTASVGGTPLGDLVTSLVNYDSSPYSSNALGRYFHDIGGRANANAMIHDRWLDRPAGETFGGNYGAAAPPLGYDFVDGAATLSITPDGSSGPANHLSGLTIAEALKRLVMHREDAATRMPGIQWADLRVLFYGADASPRYGEHGGMSADTAVYLQQAHDIDYIERRSGGRWRIFSKLGLGSSGQLLDVGYACLPVVDPSGRPVADWGREFVIATHLPTGGTSWADRDRILARAYRAIVTRIVDGRL